MTLYISWVARYMYAHHNGGEWDNLKFAVVRSPAVWHPRTLSGRSLCSGSLKTIPPQGRLWREKAVGFKPPFNLEFLHCTNIKTGFCEIQLLTSLLNMASLGPHPRSDLSIRVSPPTFCVAMVMDFAEVWMWLWPMLSALWVCMYWESCARH
jgi:hypothetical protein